VQLTGDGDVMKLKLVWLFLLAFLGCTPTKYVHNVPNLVQVSPGLWRSGQPVNDADWKYLHDELGITQDVKLNFESEGSDDGAVRAGMTVHVLSIQPEGDKDLLDNLTNTFVSPDRGNITEAERVIRGGGGVLVHCTHGQDRTGLVLGIHRAEDEGWTKDAAYEEMLEHGFHPELHGLHEFWETFGGTL
jgi:protein tyrosine/serine phosphatase